MKALWIRVDAHEVDSLRIEQLADALDVDVVTALGHYAALGGALAEHAPDGVIANISDGKLERWARWSGKRGRFAAAVREQLQNEFGEFSDWEDSMGKLVEQRAADRKRTAERRAKIRAEREAERVKMSSDKPPRVREQSADKGPKSAATERNGTERSVFRDSSGTSQSSTTAESQGETRENPAPRPPASLSLVKLQQLLPDGCQEFFAHFYATASLRRQRDVLQQLATLAAGQPIDYLGGNVLAYSPDRLAAKCRDVISSRLREPNSAMPMLFTKLGDTSDVDADQALPGQREAADLTPKGPLDDRVESLISGVADARSLPKSPVHGTSR